MVDRRCPGTAPQEGAGQEKVKLPWSRKGEPVTDEPPPVVRPPTDRPITEFEERRLADKGQWLTVQIQVMPKGSWVNWHHDIPDDLRAEARDALVALCLKLQGGK